MQHGKKRPAAKPLFVPVLTKPSGDRYVAFAVYQVLRELREDGQEMSFDVAVAPVEAYDANNTLKPLQVIEREIENIVQSASLSVPHEAVVFYTGHEVMRHLAPLEGRKFATTHVHPLELLQEVKGKNHDGKNWNDRSLREEFGLDMLASPAHMASDLALTVIDDPNVFWTFGVGAQRAQIDADLSDDKVFSTAHEKPLFVVSIPAPSDDREADAEMRDLMVRLIHHEEKLGDREIVLIDNPRSAHFKNDLLDALGKDYTVVSEMGAFAKRVLPAIKRHPQSKIFLPGDSASVMTESVETLPWHQIIVQSAVVRDDEQRKLVPFFYHHGRIQTIDGHGKVNKPQAPNDKDIHAAYDVASAAVEKFVHDTDKKFTPRDFVPRRA